MNIYLEDLNETNFQIQLSKDKDLIVKFIGIIDMKESHTILDEYFEKLNSEIINNSLKEIKLDFSELKFLNSSGIKSLINWLSKIKVSKKENQYMFNLILNRTLSWQQDCFKVIGILAKDIVKFN